MTADEARSEIARRYDKNPRNWHYVSGRDARGFKDSVFLQHPDLWIIKEEVINPFKTVGFAVKTDYDEGKVSENLSEFTFGLRPISSRQLKSIVTDPFNPKQIDSVIGNLLGRQPVSLSELRSPIALHGPVIRDDSFLQKIMPPGKQLQKNLQTLLVKELGRKHPSTLTSYI